MLLWNDAGVAQLVERNLAKVEVAGPSPVFRSKPQHIAEVFCFYSLSPIIPDTVPKSVFKVR